MTYSYFGESKLKVSDICLGTMDFGTLVPAERSWKIMDRYLEYGGNFFDTANVYAFWNPGGKGGESERVLGEWIRERGVRDRVVVATKLGFARPGDAVGLRSEQIMTHCEESLKRLGVETIDLYYAHLDDRRTPLEESLEAFDRLVRQGKVREIGASNYTAWRLERALNASRRMGVAQFCCLQQRYSYLRLQVGTALEPQQPVTDDVLDFCLEENFPLLAYTPLLGGCYVRDDRKLPPQYLGEDTEIRLSTIRNMAYELGITANQLVLLWLLRNTPKAIPVIGTSSLKHFDENMESINMSIAPEDLQILNDAGPCNEKRLILIGDEDTEF